MSDSKSGGWTEREMELIAALDRVGAGRWLSLTRWMIPELIKNQRLLFELLRREAERRNAGDSIGGLWEVLTELNLLVSFDGKPVSMQDS